MKGLISIVILCFTISIGKTQNAVDILNKMDSTISTVTHLECLFYKKERINSKFEESLSLLKYQKSPFKVYMKSNSPREGLEVLYREGKNDGDVLINPNSFPYFNFSFDPMGNTLRNKQHHTVYDLGFTTLQSLYHQFKANNPNYISYLSLEKDTVFENQTCFKVVIDYTPFQWYDYTVQENEDLTSIAYKLGVNDYMIKEYNDIDDYDDVDEGDVIKVPNNYALKTIFYISKTSYLPIMQTIYDDKGLYEHFEYRDLIINPTFEDNELEEDYSEYGF